MRLGEKFLKDLEKGTAWDLLNSSIHSHTNARHGERTFADILNEALLEKRTISAFYSEGIARDLTLENVLYNFEKINQFMEKSEDPKFVIHADFDTEMYEDILDQHNAIGYVFRPNESKNTLDFGQSSSITTVLRKDAQAPYGFTITTSYPDGKNLIPEPIPHFERNLKETAAYQKANSVKKAYFFNQCLFGQAMTVSYKEDRYNGEPTLKLRNQERMYRFTKDQGCFVKFLNEKQQPLPNPYTKYMSESVHPKYEANLNHKPIRSLFAKEYPNDHKILLETQQFLKDLKDPMQRIIPNFDIKEIEQERMRDITE